MEINKEGARVFVDMDDVLVDYASGFEGLEGTPKWKDKTIAGVFYHMKPMPGAVEAFHRLASHYDTYVLSTGAWRNESSWSDKLRWVKKYLGESAYKRLILTHNKALCMGEYLIDDRTTNGAGNFKGEHIHFGTEKFPNWEAVLEYLDVPNENLLTGNEWAQRIKGVA